jgi:hypothetical protein
MAVAESAVWRMERTFDWFSSPTAQVGLRVTTRANGQDLGPDGKPDPDKRGLLLIDRSGAVLSAGGYCRRVDRRRVWIEAGDDSPVIEVTFLEGAGPRRLSIHLDADGMPISAAELAAWVVVRPGSEHAWRQCLRCGAWCPVEDEAPAAFCRGCQRVLARMNQRLHDGGGYGPTWRQCERCGTWYRDRQARDGLGVCDTCYGNGERPAWLPATADRLPR